MTVFLIVLHVLVCVFLILFVLLQPGARGGVGAAFGAGGQTVFGGRGANTFLAKLTAAAAVVFMITSISLSYFVSKSSSVMKDRVPAATPTATTTDDDKKDDAAAKDDAKDADKDVDDANPTPESGNLPSGAAPVGDAPPTDAPPTDAPPIPAAAPAASPAPPSPPEAPTPAPAAPMP
jgi:preprotein translocase subunit SecG